MKPGVDVACTGVLPHAIAVAWTVSATARSVARPLTTSTSCISGTGLKKCMPTMRPGDFIPAASSVIDSDDVFDARIAAGGTITSSSRSRPRLVSRSSTIASTTSSALTQSPSAWTGAIRAVAAAAAAASSLPLAARPARVWPIPSRARSAAPIRVSNRRTGCPAWAATWAMPMPMAPAPMTATVASRGSAPPTSAPGETGRALLQERGNAFAVVGTETELALQVALEIELLFQRIARRRVHRALDRGEPAGRRVRQLREHRVDGRRKLRVVDAFPDQAPGRCLFRRYPVAQHRETHRARAPREPRQEIRSAGIRHEPDPAE